MNEETGQNARGGNHQLPRVFCERRTRGRGIREHFGWGLDPFLMISSTYFVLNFNKN